MAQQPKEQVVNLYQGSKRIHPKLAKGRFANWRILAILATQLVFYVIPWLTWSGRQAVLFDIPGRHFYIFGITLVPGDLIYLTGLLLLSAFGLFWWTTIAGRLWCGYACPQTVYTEVMLWIDHLVEGDRNKRLKLDKEPWNARKIRIKFTKYLLIFVVCAWTGITFAGWFTPIRELVPAFFNFTVSGGALFAAAFYGFATFFMAHIMREQVCKYMCPYARFQSAMFDNDTLIISYDEERGEPRGARKKNLSSEEAGLGDCINCTMCVQVCPVGIDIRDGLQYECIGCAACIDVCDQVMDKVGLPRGLIRYSTENAIAQQLGKKEILGHIVRPRILLYTAILLLITGLSVWFLAHRIPLKVDIIRDRSTLAREADDGRIENVFMLQIMNTEEQPHRYKVTVDGLPDLKISGADEVDVPPATLQSFNTIVSVPPDAGKPGANQIHLEITALDNPDIKVREKASFLLP